MSILSVEFGSLVVAMKANDTQSRTNNGTMSLVMSTFPSLLILAGCFRIGPSYYEQCLACWHVDFV